MCKAIGGKQQQGQNWGQHTVPAGKTETEGRKRERTGWIGCRGEGTGRLKKEGWRLDEKREGVMRSELGERGQWEAGQSPGH